MKKSWRFLCFISIIMVLTMTLLSCQGGHIHKFSDKWIHDDDKHWKECSECGVQDSSAPHQIDDIWKHDNTSHWKECLDCGYHKNSEPHQFGEWKIVNEPSEDNAGLKERTCSCGYIEQEKIEPVQHIHSYGEWEVQVEPTENNSGSLVRTCEIDGSNDSFTLPALNKNDYEYTLIKAATCEAGGREEYVYTKDNQTFKFEHTLDALLHNYSIAWEWEGTTATAVFTCQNDNSHVERVPAQVSVNTISEATCTQSGSYYCEAWVMFNEQGYRNEKTVEVSHLEHQYGTDWVYDGEKHYYACALCGEHKDEGNHTFENNVCTVCGAEQFSSGLYFSNNGDYYSVNIGTCTDTEIIVPSSYQGLPVKEISWGGFSEQENITSIHLPESIEYIYASAFSGCTKLVELNIPQNVTSIGSRAFAGCESLTSITIPEGVTELSSEIFKGCSKLTNITIPEGITSIEYGVFSGCASLTSFTLPEGITEIPSGLFKDCTSLTSFTIPSIITSIGAEAFKGSGLLEIIIPKNIEKIEGSAFEDCEALTKVEVGSTTTWMDGCVLEAIEAHAFRNCSSLKEIYLPVSLKKIGMSAFEGCNLDKVYIKADNANSWIATTFEDLDSNPIYHSKELYTWQPSIIGFGKPEEMNLAFTSETGVIGAYAFAGLKGVNKVRIENAIVKNYAFYETTASLILVDIKSIGSYAFAGTNLQVFTSYTVESIGDHAFDSCKDLEKVTLPSKITDVGSYVFNGCSNLKSASIPYSLIDKMPSYLESLEVRNTSKISSIPFENLKTIEFSDEVKTISNDVFKNCTKLLEVEFNGLVEEWCRINFGNEYSNPMVYASVCKMDIKTPDGIYKDDEIITQLVLPDTITSVYSYTFANFNHLEKVTLPSNITGIGTNAFKGCNRLVEIYNYSTNINLTIGSTDYGRIAEYAKVIHTQEEESNIIETEDGFVFVKDQDGNYYLISYKGTEKELTLPADIEGHSYNINSGAFENSNITSVIISEGTTSIGEKAFANCNKLTNITIPSSITNIDENAFEQCYRLVEIFNYSSIDLEEKSDENGGVAKYAKVIHTQAEPSKLIKTEDGFVFLKKNKRYYLVAYTGTEQVLTLPNEIEGSIYRINDYAFYGVDYLLSIVIPNSVKYIGRNVLTGCTKLESISIPFIGDSLTNKQVNCFAYLFGASSYMDDTSGVPSSLREVSLTAETSLGSNIFYGCYIPTINIPESLISIDDDTFVNCNGMKYNEYDNGLYLGNKENPYLWLMHTKNNYQTDSLEIHPDTKHIFEEAIRYFGGLTSIVIPEGVVSIGDYAFYGCRGLTSIVIPNSVTSIGEGAFNECSGLTSIVIPNSITSIGRTIVSGCDKLQYTEYEGGCYLGNEENPYVLFVDAKSHDITNLVIHPDTLLMLSLEDYPSLASITIPFVGAIRNGTEKNQFKHIFYFNGNDYIVPSTLTDVVVTGGNIGDSAFLRCKGLTNITIQDGITSIGSYAFYDCEALTNITISKSVLSIGNYAFSYCSGLTNVYYDGTIKDWCNISFESEASNPMYFASHFFLKNSSNEWEEVTSLNIPEEIVEIGNYQFYGFNSVTSLNISSDVTNIGSHAFYKCSEISILNMGNSVKAIGEYAFFGCSSLKSLTVGSDVTSIGEYAFANCSGLLSVVIPNNVTSIGEYAFTECNSLASMSIPFVGASLNGTENTHFGYIFGSDPEFGNSSYVPSSLKEVIITGGDSIKRYAFYGCSDLTNVIIPNSVTTIEAASFYACNGLTSITIPFVGSTYMDGSQLGMFRYLFDDTSYSHIPNGLSEVIITGGDSIEKGAFNGCRNLTRIVLPNSVTSIGSRAFYDCENLVYNEYDNGCYLGNNDNPYLVLIKAKSTDITSCELSPNTKFIYSDAFANCTKLASVTLNNGLISIGFSAFTNCPLLPSVVIPEGVTSIESSAFSSCSILEEITIPSSVTSIGENAFRYCDKLTKVYFLGSAEDLVKLNFRPFTNSKQGSVYIKNDANEWEEVTSLEIPEGVTEISEYQFENYTNLNSVIIPNGVTTIGTAAFSCCALTNITLPKTLTSIGYNAFTVLDNVYYEGTIEDWCNIKFDSPNSNPISLAEHFYMRNSNNEWEEVTSIVIPEGVTSIGNYQFYGFDNLTSISIPNSVTKVGKDAFDMCDKLTYNKSNDMSYLGNDDNLYVVLIKSESTSLVTEVNQNTKVIYQSAFENSNVTSITLPDSLTSIGASAFSGCSKLANIRIPNNVTYIGDYAFNGCSSFTNVVVPDSVTFIGLGAFEGCDSLTTLTIPFLGVKPNDTTYTHLGYIFGTTYYSDNAEYVPSGLKKVYVTGEGKIEDYAIYGCNLEYNVYDNGIYFGSYENPYMLFVKAKSKDITSCEIHPDTKQIYAFAFSGCSSLTSVTIPGGITNIGKNAFNQCSNLSDIYYGGSILDWCNIVGGDDDHPVWNPMYYASHFYMKNSNDEWEELTDLVIPEGVTSIRNYQFYGLDCVTSLTISSSVTELQEDTFECRGVDNIKSAKVPAWLLSYIPGVAVTDLIITDGDTLGYCVRSYDELVNITIPKSITKVEYWSIISECSENLANVYYEGSIDDWIQIEFMGPECNPMSLAEHLFVKNSDDEWEEVTSIIIPDGTTEIKDYQYYGFDSVTSITIPDSVTTIGKGAFELCSSLTTITIPSGVTHIDDAAFAQCQNLTSIVIPNSVEVIGKGVFKDYDELTGIYFMGTETEFQNIDIIGNKNIYDKKCYYYSETEPNDIGRYWSYDEETIIKW